jgi:hypothetical protein
MNFLELLKGSGLAVLTTAISFYICGWQYYLGFFHRFKIDIYFSIPPENAVGQGLQPIATFITVPVFSALLGVVLVRCRDRYSWMGGKPYLPALAGGFCGTILPFIVHLTNTDWLNVEMGGLLWLIFAIAGAILGGLVAHLVCSQWMEGRKDRYYFYALTAGLFLVATAYYAQMRGKATAASYSEMKPASTGNDRRATASVHSSDLALEEKLKGWRVIPLLTVGDDVLLLRMNPDPGGKPSIVAVKKALVAAMDFGNEPSRSVATGRPFGTER